MKLKIFLLASSILTSSSFAMDIQDKDMHKMFSPLEEYNMRNSVSWSPEGRYAVAMLDYQRAWMQLMKLIMEKVLNHF